MIIELIQMLVLSLTKTLTNLKPLTIMMFSSTFGDASKTYTQLETLASTSKQVKLDSELDSYTSLLSNNISSPSNIEMDLLEEDTLDKGKQLTELPANPLLQDYE